MKKILFLVLTSLVLFSCKKEKPQQQVEFVVENTISMDKQEMFLNHGENYRWFETCMMLENYLDEENDGTLAEVVNVFQAATALDEKSFDVKVFKFQHFADGTVLKDSVSGFWIEDEPLNNEKIVLTYKDAFEKLMQANIAKPHSRYCTLRKQVGPINANAQYIFGNTHETVFVDAVTGEVLGYNPAFPQDSLGFKMPLGEWP